jgi:hypothetical protein
MSLTTKGPSDHLQHLSKHADKRQAFQVFHGLNNFPCLTADVVMVVPARQNGQLIKEIKKWKKDFQKPISD